MDEAEDFDGSALRPLLTPVVADRGRTAAPADAIVAAGRRRVRGRRATAAGGALAVVAAVPLAAVIAAGPGRTGTVTANVAPTGGGAPAHTSAPHPGPPTSTPASPGAPARTGGGPARTSVPPAADGLPAGPRLLASGVIEGRPWSVSGIGEGIGEAGSTDPGGKQRCLNLLISQSGQTIGAGYGDHIAYCLPYTGSDTEGANYEVYQFGAGIQGGVGMLAVGTAPPRIAKVRATVTGVPAPITVDTVPAPGVPNAVLFIVPIPKDDTVRATYDGYDAHGALISSFNSWSLANGVFSLSH